MFVVVFVGVGVFGSGGVGVGVRRGHIVLGAKRQSIVNIMERCIQWSTHNYMMYMIPLTATLFIINLNLNHNLTQRLQTLREQLHKLHVRLYFGGLMEGKQGDTQEKQGDAQEHHPATAALQDAVQQARAVCTSRIV